MKSALNGGLNLSIRDGWWDEWYDGENGWEIPTADGLADENRRDDIEASALYELLEHAVAPKFYDRDDAGVPTRWVEMVRHTLQVLGPKVLASRMVRDYTEKYYIAGGAVAAPVDRAGPVECRSVQCAVRGCPRTRRVPAPRRARVAADQDHRRGQLRAAGHPAAGFGADADRAGAAGRAARPTR